MVLGKGWRFKKRKKIYQRKIFWRVIFLFLFLVLVFDFFAFSPLFELKKIEFKGNENLNLKLLETEILVDTKGKIFFNSRNLEEKILKKFPEIEAIKISKSFQKIIVKLKERKPIFNFVEGEKFFLISEDGVLFKKGKKEDLIEIGKEKYNAKFGERVFSKEEIEKMLEILEKIKEFSPKKIKFIDSEKVSFLTGDELEIYFSLEKPIDWQITKLKTLIEKEFSSKEELKNLEYIDLRFGNFATFKLKKERLEGI